MKKTIIAIIAALVPVIGASAQQTFISTYFLEGYNHRHQFNPAFASKTSYFAVPILCSFNLETQSNLGISTFLYPIDGRLTTFMDSAIPAEEFLGKLSSENILNVDNQISMMSFGIRRDKSFFSFDVNAITSVSLNLPYSLFDFMKHSETSQNYEISNITARMNGRLEFAFGYSRSVTKKLNIGARVKFLVGVANVEVDAERTEILTNEDKWSVHSYATLKSSSFMDIRTKGETGAEIEKPSDRDMLDFGDVKTNGGKLVNGFGAAVDLGAEMEVAKGLKLSLSINDLGYLGWRNTTVARTSGEEWSYDGFKDISFDASKDNWNDQLDDLIEETLDMFDFRRTEKNGAYGGMIAATVNAGVEYTMPFYNALSAGLLSSTHINGKYSWTQTRLFANLRPAKWFSCGLNFAMARFGWGVGAAIGFHAPGFNLFIGSDRLPLQKIKVYDEILYPYGKLNTSVNFGISFNLGGRSKESV